MHIHIYSMVAMSRVIYHPPPPCSLVPAKPRSSYTTHALDSQATGRPQFLICKQNDNCARGGWETRDTEDTPWLGLYSERQSHSCGRVECRMVFLVPLSHHTPSGHTTSLCRSRLIVASLSTVGCTSGLFLPFGTDERPFHCCTRSIGLYFWIRRTVL